MGKRAVLLRTIQKDVLTMEKYQFYYRDLLLGVLEVENGKHRYIPQESAVKETEKIYPLDRVMKTGSDG